MVARTGGEQPGMVDGRSDRGGAWGGHAEGVGRAGVPGTWERRAGSATGRWGVKEGRLAPGPWERDVAGGRSGQGTREARGCPPPLRDLRGPRIPPARSGGCLAGEAAGSAEPTPAHTIPESMLSAALGTSCLVASRPGPLPAPSRPAAAKLGGAARSSGPFASPGPCLVFALLPVVLLSVAPAAEDGGVNVAPSFPRPGPRPGGQRHGGEAA